MIDYCLVKILFNQIQIEIQNLFDIQNKNKK
jgi:hypothetical protein